MKYYGGGSSFSTDILEGDSSDKHFHAHYPIKKDDLLIHLYVELINKNNPDIKFSFSKYFATGDIIEGTSNIEEIDDEFIENDDEDIDSLDFEDDTDFEELNYEDEDFDV